MQVVSSREIHLLATEVRAEHLDDGWAGDGVGVSDRALAADEDGIALSHWAELALGDDCADGVVAVEGGLDKDVARHKRVGNEHLVGHLGTLLDGKRGLGTTLKDARTLEDQFGECLDGQDWVALGARLDEWCSERVDFVEVKGVVEWLRERRRVDLRAEVGAVTGLDAEDGGSLGQVLAVGDEVGSASVGGNADTLEDCSGLDEALWRQCAKVVLACLDWLLTGGLEGGGQDGNVGVLVLGDVLEILVEGVLRETSVGHVLCRELAQAVRVEGGLEVLEGQGVVEDDTVDVVTLLESGRSGHSRGRKGSNHNRLHDVGRLVISIS